eukprot:84007-Prymnesium_polylepis.1
MVVLLEQLHVEESGRRRRGPLHADASRHAAAWSLRARTSRNRGSARPAISRRSEQRAQPR